MDKNFEYVLEIFINETFGRYIELPKEINIDMLLTTAENHGIHSVVSKALSECENINVDAEKKRKLKEFVKNLRITTYFKQVQLAQILKEFEAKEIPYALIKGHTVAQLYNDPCSRISSDIDLLVNFKDEKKAEQILQEYGFEMKKLRTKDDKHSIMHHPALGLLELHISLYNKETAKVWFNAAHGEFDVEIPEFNFDDLQKIEIGEDYFYTLEINKRIEYLFLHNVKHFILGGSSIRAIMDFFLTYVRCDVDYDLFAKKIKVMGLETLFNVMISSIERFMSFEEIIVPFYKKADDAKVDAFLEDLYIGKWLGYSEENKEAKFGWKTYEQEKRKDMGAKRQSNTKIKRIVISVFPPVNRLKNNYSYALKHPVLLPVAWFHRLFRIIFKRSKETYNFSKSKGMRRIDLMKQMNIL